MKSQNHGTSKITIFSRNLNGQNMERPFAVMEKYGACIFVIIAANFIIWRSDIWAFLFSLWLLLLFYIVPCRFVLCFLPREKKKEFQNTDLVNYFPALLRSDAYNFLSLFLSLSLFCKSPLSLSLVIFITHFTPPNYNLVQLLHSKQLSARKQNCLPNQFRIRTRRHPKWRENS